MDWTLKKIAEVSKGKIYYGDDSLEANGFSIDTRTIANGDIYIGIKGENFDGNMFYKDAFDNGAKAAILNNSIKNTLPNDIKRPIILVEDTIKALADLASAWLNELKIPVIAITGSVGKTSTKDMIHAILSEKYNTFKPIKNYNNHIGLPYSILSITKSHEAVILEMGMNHLEEITYLSNIAKPDLAVITTVLPVHIEFLETIENILQAKLEITKGLKKDGTLIINNDNDFLRNAKIDCNIFTCGIDYESDLKVEKIEENKIQVKYQNEIFEFYHNNFTKAFIQNLLLGIAVGLKLNIPYTSINEAIKKFELTEGRLQKINLNDNILLINDAYNANTNSMKNAIDYLNKQKCKRRIAIFGNMRELGNLSKELHCEVGRYINSSNLDYLITIGNDAKNIFDNANISNKMHFNNKDEIYPFFKTFIKKSDCIIIKAANGEKFIEIVDYLKELYR